MITISAVPTRRPVPRVEIRRICLWEREKKSGSEPARKDLFSLSIDAQALEDLCGTDANAMMPPSKSTIHNPSHILDIPLRALLKGK